MRRIAERSLWLGHAGDLRDLRAILSAGIEAVIDVAAEEPMPLLTRDLVSFRFPVIDGEGNPDWMLRTAIDAITGLIAAEVPTLVACGAGMSRSPVLVAGALARHTKATFDAVLSQVIGNGPADVSPDLMAAVRQILAR